MNISELKMRLLNKANSLIDVYFSNNGLTEKFINSTLKIIMKQNIHKIDNVFELFADKNGDKPRHPGQFRATSQKPLHPPPVY